MRGRYINRPWNETTHYLFGNIIFQNEAYLSFTVYMFKKTKFVFMATSRTISSLQKFAYPQKHSKQLTMTGARFRLLAWRFSCLNLHSNIAACAMFDFWTETIYIGLIFLPFLFSYLNNLYCDSVINSHRCIIDNKNKIVVTFLSAKDLILTLWGWGRVFSLLNLFWFLGPNNESMTNYRYLTYIYAICILIIYWETSNMIQALNWKMYIGISGDTLYGYFCIPRCPLIIKQKIKNK